MVNDNLIINIIPQPDWISDDDIAELLHDAHKSTLEKGMNYAVLTQNGKDIRKRIGENGIFFVALLDGNKLAGVTGLAFNKKSNAWYARNKTCAEVKLVGVKSEYKGLSIFDKLQDIVYQYAFQKVDLLLTNTAAENYIMLNNNLRRGWKVVDYISWKNTNYYSIIMAKWKDGCPYSDTFCKFNYILRKLITKTLKTKDGNYTLIARLIKRI